MAAIYCCSGLHIAAPQSSFCDISIASTVPLQDLCLVLSELHDRAPIHSWAASKAEIEKAFGKPVEELFDSIEQKALASGSIAQVCH